MTLTVLDCFSGIGGFSLGLERTGGFRTVQFIEIDLFCQRVLKKHWPDVPCHDDIQTYEFREGEADVITGGFPCQDISVAGRGAGLAGERSGLWRELVRAVGVVRPRYALFENVAALLSRGLDQCLSDLAALGYDAEWHCIPAATVGAPHRRDRIWVVAYARCQRDATWGESRDLACATREVEEDSQKWKWLRNTASDGCKVMADSVSLRQPQPQGSESDEWRRSGNGGQGMGDTNSTGQSLVQGRSASEEFGWFGAACSADLRSGRNNHWCVEPDVGRVADGIPRRVDRLRGLGNAVVPQIPELIGNAILEAERNMAA